MKTLIKTRYTRDAEGHMWKLVEGGGDYVSNYSDSRFEERITSKEATQFFKNLGGEEITKSDFEHVSISPDKTDKTVFTLVLTEDFEKNRDKYLK